VSAGTLTRESRGPGSGATARASSIDRDKLLLALLILGAAALRFWRLRHQGFWFDEGNTAQEVRDTPGQMLTLLKHYESTPPFYYCVAWVWARIFGFGEAGLRSLSAVCGVLVVPLSYALGQKLFSRRTALIVAALAATNPLLIWYSQEARAYEMTVLLTGVALLAFLYAEEDASPRAIAVWAVACALALATEYYTALVIAPMGLWLLYRHRRERPLQLAIGALALWCVPVLWFAVSQNSTGHASWIKHLPLAPRIGQTFPQFLIGYGAPGGVLLSWVAGVIALIALGALALHVRHSTDGWRRSALLVGGILLSAVVLMGLLVAGGLDNLISRNLISVWLLAALLVAAGLALRRLGVIGLVLAAVLCATGIAAAVGVSVDRKYQRPDWRGVVRVLNSRPAAGVAERAILIQDYRDVLPLSLYMPHLAAWHHTGTDKYSHYTHSYAVSELDIVAIRSWPAPSTGCWWGSGCNLIGTTLQSSYRIPGFHAVWIRHVYQFTILHMVAAHPVVVTPQMVSNALSETKLKYDDLLVQKG
jgi:mannosyltransferase